MTVVILESGVNGSVTVLDQCSFVASKESFVYNVQVAVKRVTSWAGGMFSWIKASTTASSDTAEFVDSSLLRAPCSFRQSIPAHNDFPHLGTFDPVTGDYYFSLTFAERCLRKLKRVN